MDQDEKNLKILEIAGDIRKFEIGLFWSRSLFFWGFTAITITAYGAAHQYAPKEVQFAAACAGLVCSVIWTLVNRSSKFWQKVWEVKAGNASREAIGCDLFLQDRSEPMTVKDFPWWRAHFSVSKLAMAFSDFTVLVWAGLAFKATPLGVFVPQTRLIPVVAACTAIYIVYIFVMCRPDAPGNSN